MKQLEDIQKCVMARKNELHRDYKVKEIGIFGSYARGEQQDKSDLDVLVDFDETIGLFKFVALERYLSQLLGVKVDLVMKSTLKPRIGTRILEEVCYIFLKYEDGINASFGAWNDDEHPELKNGTDNYIRDLRKSRTF